MLIQTTKGEIEAELMTRVTQDFKSEEAITRATEYWLDGELVHRSVAIELIGRDLGAVQENLA